jgi:fumarate reductase flavoprotein subunit
MKRLLAIIMCIFLLISVVGCSTPTNNSEGLAYTAGTYIGVSENGKNGPVKVEVKFGEDKIESVKVIEHKETAGLTDSAIERIPNEIVEYQSLNIDSISGATITCDAILEAVADSVKQAKGDVEALKAKEVNKNVSNEVVEMKADVVIIGGGATGMGAAISASQSGAESVIVL